MNKGINIKGFDWEKTTIKDIKKIHNTFFVAKNKKRGREQLSDSSFNHSLPESSFKFNYKKPKEKTAQDIINEVNTRIIVK